MPQSGSPQCRVHYPGDRKVGIKSFEIWKDHAEFVKLLSTLDLDYLLSRRPQCRVCGAKMAACGSFDGYKNRLYYRCHVARGYAEYERKCNNGRHFKAEDVDFTVWEWLKDFVRNPVVIDEGIKEYEEDQDREQSPIKERLTVVDELLSDHRDQLQKLLDIYLDGGFPKDLLAERRQRLQDTIGSLATERINLAAKLHKSAYSGEQLQVIKQYAQEIAAGIDEAEDDFESRKHVVEMLNVYAKLVVENEEIVERLGLMEAGGMIRVGPVHYNTLDELERFGEVLKKVAA